MHFDLQLQHVTLCSRGMSKENSIKSPRALRFCVEIAAYFLLWSFLAALSHASDIEGKVAAQGMKSPASIIVYIDAVPGKTYDPPHEHPVINQKRMVFMPHVLPVLKGTTVDFVNNDAVNHNVFWPSVGGNKKLRYNLGTWSQGGMKSFTFENLGAVPLLCFLHPEMSAYIIVMPTPYYAITDENGAFTIKDVPPGNYTLKTWSEEGKPFSQSIQVSEGELAVNLVVVR